MTETEELQQKIKTSQGALLTAASRRNSSWFTLLVSVALLVWMATKVAAGATYLWLAGLCVLYVGLNVWRIIRLGQQKQKAEADLSEYRSRLAELEAAPGDENVFSPMPPEQAAMAADEPASGEPD